MNIGKQTIKIPPGNRNAPDGIFQTNLRQKIQVFNRYPQGARDRPAAQTQRNAVRNQRFLTAFGISAYFYQKKKFSSVKNLYWDNCEDSPSAEYSSSNFFPKKYLTVPMIFFANT